MPIQLGGKMELAQDAIHPLGELHWNPASSSKHTSPVSFSHPASSSTDTTQKPNTSTQQNKSQNKNTNKYKNKSILTLRNAHKSKKRKGRFLNKFNSKQRKQMKIALEGLPSGSAGLPRELAHSGDQVAQASQVNRKRNTKRCIRSKQELQKGKPKEASKEE